MTPRDQEGAKEIWLRCPVCKWTWRGMVVQPARYAAALEAIKDAECNRCDTDQPMQVVDGPERRGKR